MPVQTPLKGLECYAKIMPIHFQKPAWQCESNTNCTGVVFRSAYEVPDNVNAAKKKICVDVSNGIRDEVHVVVNLDY